MSASLLGTTERETAAQNLPGWSWHQDRDTIKRCFKFKGFNEAFGFMTRVAMRAEQLNHHPEWSNVYNRVEVTLTTHECKGISKLDIQLARFMDRIYTGAHHS
jgi:4a-hydroxytetrahydrobiopterin dehydratase